MNINLIYFCSDPQRGHFKGYKKNKSKAHLKFMKRVGRCKSRAEESRACFGARRHQGPSTGEERKYVSVTQPPLKPPGTTLRKGNQVSLSILPSNSVAEQLLIIKLWF